MPAYTGENKACYAYAPGDTKSDYKLPICNQNGDLDSAIIGAAAAALSSGGYRGQRVSLPSDAIAGVKAKLRGAWRRANPNRAPADMPASITASENEVHLHPVPVRPLMFAAAQDWIAYLPRPGLYQHGLYGELDLTPDKLARLVANFQDNIYGQLPPINAEHDGPASGAIGWITEMRLAADGSIEVKPQWNNRGQALLDGDRFRYVSAEFFDQWQDPVSGDWHADVPVGLAICTRPHFKTDVLRPLAASEAEALAMASSEPIRWTAPEETQMSERDNPKEEPKEEPAAEPMTAPVDVPEEESVPEEEKAPAEAPAEAVALTEQAVRRFHEMERKLATTEKQLAEERSGRAVEQRDNRIKRFSDEVRGRSDANSTPWTGDIEAHVAFMIDLAEKFGEHSPQLQHYLTVMRSAADRDRQSQLFGKLGTAQTKDALTPLDQIALFAREKRFTDPKLSQQQAEAQVLKDHPELYAEYIGQS